MNLALIPFFTYCKNRFSRSMLTYDTEDSSEGAVEEVGGISNIPGLSSSEEEKLLEYSSYQSEEASPLPPLVQPTSTTSSDLFESELESEATNVDFESTVTNQVTEMEYEPGDEDSFLVEGEQPYEEHLEGITPGSILCPSCLELSRRRPYRAQIASQALT